MEPVVAGQGRQAQVGDHEPLGAGGLATALLTPLRLGRGLGQKPGGAGGQGIDPRLEVRDQGTDRNGGGDLAVQLALDPALDLALDLNGPGPDLLTALIGDLFRLITVE